MIEGVCWTIADVHGDERGYVFETARLSDVAKLSGGGILQVNVSFSRRGVLRGMHVHQHQWDFWGVASGKIQVCLSDGDTDEYKTLSVGGGVVIPPGVAHGFLALEDTMLIYAVTNEFNREHPDEGTICFQQFKWALEDLALEGVKVIASARDWGAC